MHKKDFFAALGKRIKKIRIEKKMPQQTLAVLCNFEKSNMSRIEKGVTNPTIGTLLKISNALNVPVSHLLDHEGEHDEKTLKHRMHNSLDIGARLKALRREKNYTVDSLAELCNCGHSDILDIESGHHNSDIVIINNICAALGISVVGLLHDDHAKHPIQ